MKQVIGSLTSFVCGFVAGSLVVWFFGGNK